MANGEPERTEPAPVTPGNENTEAPEEAPEEPEPVRANHAAQNVRMIARPPEETSVDTNEEDEPAARRDRLVALRVTVVPWGDVWADGRWMGRAPVTLRLEPGRHRIGAGAENPTQSRTVTVRPGRQRTITINLEE